MFWGRYIYLLGKWYCWVRCFPLIHTAASHGQSTILHACRLKKQSTENLWFVLLTILSSGSSLPLYGKLEGNMPGGRAHILYQSRRPPQESSFPSVWPDWVSLRYIWWTVRLLKFEHQNRWLLVDRDNAYLTYGLLYDFMGPIFWNTFQLPLVTRATPLRTPSVRLMAPF